MGLFNLRDNKTRRTVLSSVFFGTLAVIFLATASYMISSPENFLQVSAQFPCNDDPVTCANDVSPPTYSYDTNNTTRSNITDFLPEDFDSGIADLQLEYNIDNLGWNFVSDTDFDNNISFNWGEYGWGYLSVNMDMENMLSNYETYSTLDDFSYISYRIYITNGASFATTATISFGEIPVPDDFCEANPGTCEEDDTPPSVNIEGINPESLFFLVDDEGSGIYSVIMEYNLGAGWVQIDDQELLESYQSLEDGDFGQTFIAVYYQIYEILKEVEDVGTISSLESIGYRFTFTNGNGLSTTSEEVYVEPDTDRYQFSIDSPVNYRKALQVSVSEIGNDCQSYPTVVEVRYTTDGQEVTRTVGTGYSSGDNSCSFTGSILIDDKILDDSFSQMNGRYNDSIDIRVQLSDGSYFPAEVDSTPQYINQFIYYEFAFYMTQVSGFPTDENPEFRADLYNVTVNFPYNESNPEFLLFTTPDPATQVQLPFAFDGTDWVADVSGLGWDFSEDNTLYIFLKTDLEVFEGEPETAYYPYRLPDRSDDAAAAAADQYFEFTVRGYNPPAPEPLPLSHDASDPYNVILEIDTRNRPPELDLIHIRRIDGACSEINIPTDRNAGIRVTETRAQLSRIQEVVDDEAVPGARYCYAVFLNRTDTGWLDTIEFGVTPNYTSVKVPGVRHPLAFMDVYPEDPTQNQFPQITGTAIDDEGDVIARIEYVVTVTNCCVIEDWTDILPDDGVFDSSTETFTISPTVAPVDGDVVYTVRVTDEWGNVIGDGNHGREQVTLNAVDATPPQTIIYDTPDIIYQPDPIFQVDVVDDPRDLTSDITNAQYSLDNTNWNNLTPLDGAFDEKRETFDIALSALSPGNYTLYVRGTDASNQTTNPPTELDFEIAEQPENLEARNISVSETFGDSSTSARDLTSAIWGNGIARLRAKNTITRTPIMTDPANLAVPYSAFADNIPVVRSTNDNGYWVSIYPEGNIESFMFIGDDGSTQVYETDVDYGFPTGNQSIKRMRSIDYLGEEYVVLAGQTGVGVFNTKNTPYDLSDDDAVWYNDSTRAELTGFFEYNAIEVIRKPGGEFGIVFYVNQPSRSAFYIEPIGDLNDPSDDILITWNTQTEIFEGGAARYVYQPGTNYIWVPKVQHGNDLIRWDFNGTIENIADDTFTPFSVRRSSDVAFSASGDIFVSSYDDGVVRIDADTDAVTTVQPISSFGNIGLESLHYVADEEFPLGEQFYVVSLSGENLYHLYPNNTYDDPNDDQIIQYNIFQGLFPFNAPQVYVLDFNTFFVHSTRHGFFRFDLTRDYEAADTGISILSTDQHLHADFIRLEEASIIAYGNQDIYEDIYHDNSILGQVKRVLLPPVHAQSIPSHITVQVTNNGVDWYDIDIGEIVEFPTSDYRIRFRLILNQLSSTETPVIEDVDLVYSAYATETIIQPDGVSTSFDKVQVCQNEAFSATIQIVDVLNNKVDDANGPIAIALRKQGASGNSAGLSVSNSTVTAGQVALANLTIDSTNYGTYQFAVTYDGTEYLSSSAIILQDCSTQPQQNNAGQTETLNPFISFTADSFAIELGETVTLSWSSTDVSEVEITGIGIVDLEGTLEVSPEFTTTYTLVGRTSGEDLVSSLTIEVTDNPLPLTVEVSDTTVTSGETFTITWTAEGAEYVTISDSDVRNSPSGSVDRVITEPGSYLFEVTAVYPDGETDSRFFRLQVEEVLVVSDSADTDSPSTAETVAATLLVTTAATVASATGIAGGVPRFGILSIMLPKKRKYWGIVYDANESKPIPLATVQAYSESNTTQPVAQNVSDMDGKYGMVIDRPGEYIIKVVASGFKPFEKRLTLPRKSDELEIVEDIPLLKIDEEKGWFFNLRNYNRLELYNILRRILLVITVIGFAYSLYIAINYPNLVNTLIILFYSVLFVLIGYTYLKKVSKGKVKDIDTGKGVPSVAVRVYDQATQLTMALTSLNGDIKLKLTPGAYKVSASKPGYALINDGAEGPLVNVQIDQKGYFVNDVFVRKLEGSEENGNISDYGATENPFG